MNMVCTPYTGAQRYANLVKAGTPELRSLNGQKQIDTDDEQMNYHSVLNQMINNYSDVYKIPCDHQLFPK